MKTVNRNILACTRFVAPRYPRFVAPRRDSLDARVFRVHPLLRFVRGSKTLILGDHTGITDERRETFIETNDD